MRLEFARLINGAETALGTFTVPGFTVAAGDDLRVRFNAQGATPTQLTATVWKVGDPEPAAPQLSLSDSAAEIQGPGSVGLRTYVFGSHTALPVVAAFDNLSID